MGGAVGSCARPRARRQPRQARTAVALLEEARTGGGAPGGGAHGNGGGRVDGERDLHRQRGSLSLDWYRGYHGVQAVVRDVGPGGGWPTLTKTNYVEWAAVMRVKLQVRHMWEAVRYGDVDYDLDRRALDALIARSI